MSRWASAAKIDVGGRSPKPGNGLEQVRASRRMGLTHSLDSPQVYESEPVNSEPPSRESTGELPRPRSYSPKKKPAQPSLTGSSLSARIERASTVRASKNSPASQPPLPPPRTRARFSAKVCDGASSEEEKAVDADATNLTAENDNKVMTNTHELTNSSASLTVETDSSGHDDTTPVVVLPPAIAAKACDDATECKMRRSPEKRELGHDQQKHRRSALLNTETEVAEKPPSPNTIMVTAASVFGIDSSQIRTSPHYLVPKKLSQSPVGWKPRAVEATKTKLGWSLALPLAFRPRLTISRDKNPQLETGRELVESPPLPTRPDPGSNTPLAKRRSSFFPTGRDDASEDDNHLVEVDEGEKSSHRGLCGGDASCNSSPPLPPPPHPTSPPPVSPTGMPAGFSTTNIRRSRPGTFEDPIPSPAETIDEGAHSKTFSASPPKRMSPVGVKPTPSSSWLSTAKPPPLLHTSASILPIPPPETPTEDPCNSKPLPPPPLPSHPKPVPATSSVSSSEWSVNASPNRTPLSTPEKNDKQQQQDDDDIPTPPLKFSSSFSFLPQQHQLSRKGSSRVEVGRKGRGGNESAIESDLDFIRELTQYRNNATRTERQDEYEFALVLKPNDEYRDAVEVLELALDLRDGAKLSKTPSPQKLDNAKKIRESLAGLQPPNFNPGVSESSLGEEGGCNAARKPGPPQVRPGLSEGLEGGGGGARRQRLSLLDDLQEEGGMLTNRRRKELERKKKHRLVLFVEKMREGIIVRRHMAHHICDQIVLQSTDECRTITWKPLLGTVNSSRGAKSGGGVIGGGVFMGKLKRGRRTTRAESIKAAHIALVLPATDPDPSHPGFFGTRALRLSEDIPNPARTFSLLYGDWGAWGATAAEELPSGGNWTLDLECDDDVTYAMLFQGFLLLHMQTIPTSDLSLPPKPADDDMEAGSGAKGRSRPWTMRKSPSSRSSSSLTRIGSGIASDGEEGSPSVPALGASGNRGSLRKSLKFLPELLGGLSTSSKLSRRGSQRQMSCNVVMGSAPPEFFLGWTSPGTQIWSRLRMAGLEVEKLYSLDRRRVLLKIRLPTNKLEEVAEVMRLKLRKRDGTIGRFKKDHRSSFSQSADGDLFRSGESQKVIDHLIRAKIKDGGSELDVRTELGKHVVKRMPLHNQARLDALYNAWVVYWRPTPTLITQQQQQQQREFKFRGRFKTTGAAEESSSVEDEGYMTRSERLREKAEEAKEVLLKATRLSVVVLRGSMWQPLEMIADYFGEATAFYFAWMGFYTQWLIVPSIFGVIVFAFQVHAGTLDHPMMTIYAVFVILWSSAFLVLWRQRCSELAYRWGVLNFEQEEQTRSQFWGREQLDEVTGRFEREYPIWKRWATYALTMPIMVGFTAAVLLLMFTVIVRRDSASGVDRGMEDPEFWGIMLVKPMLYGIAIPILYGTCKRLGIFLNNLENHKTENTYRNALIVKVFSFRFVTVFASLYHYAFISREGSSNYKLLRLAASLCSFMTIGQWWYMIWMCYIPERVQNWQINKLKAKVEAERRKLEKAEADEAAGGGGGGAGEASRSVRRKLLDEAGDHLWEEALLKEYNLTDVFDDYTMSLIQFGYVALFSAAFPLAPLLAMINNLVQTRVDAHKICKTRRRPIALKSGGIGVWDNVLQLMTLIAVITNCALIGVTSTRWWPDDVSPATQILVVVIAEHVILFLKYWLEYTVPRVPTKVQRALLRERMEREQKGFFTDARGGDHSKFEANFSRALAGDDAVGDTTVRYGGIGGGIGSLSRRTMNNTTRASVSPPTKVVSVDENLTAMTPTASGRMRRGFSANLSGFVSSSESTTTSPARSFASCTPPRSTSTSTPEPREIPSNDRDSYDAADVSTSARFQAPLPPPTASTVRRGLETLSSSSALPPLPPRRFGWDADSTQ